MQSGVPLSVSSDRTEALRKHTGHSLDHRSMATHHTKNKTGENTVYRHKPQSESQEAVHLPGNVFIMNIILLVSNYFVFAF